MERWPPIKYIRHLITFDAYSVYFACYPQNDTLSHATLLLTRQLYQCSNQYKQRYSFTKKKFTYGSLDDIGLLTKPLLFFKQSCIHVMCIQSDLISCDANTYQMVINIHLIVYPPIAFFGLFTFENKSFFLTRFLQWSFQSEIVIICEWPKSPLLSNQWFEVSFTSPEYGFESNLLAFLMIENISCRLWRLSHCRRSDILSLHFNLSKSCQVQSVVDISSCLIW